MPDFAEGLDCAESPDFAEELDCAESPDFAEGLDCAESPIFPHALVKREEGSSPEEPSSLLLNFTKATYGTFCSPHPVAAHG